MILTTLDKFSRKDAYLEVLAMKRGGALPSAEALDKLLNFFAPALPSKAKSAEQWVSMACDNKGVREFTKFIHVKNGVATASDGHRMHWADTYLPNGTYDPKTQLLVDYKGVLPDFERVKHDRSALSEVAINEAEVGQMVCRSKGRPIQFIKFGKGGGVHAGYLTAATNGDKTLSVSVDLKDSGGGCSGVSEFGQYRIMGLRL